MDATAEGTPFGRYRLVSRLGCGDTGEVWRAHDVDHDRIVAVKLLSEKYSCKEEFERRFRREVCAAAQLNTPHAVPIHNYGDVDGRLYVDMRLIEGHDLKVVLARGPLGPARAVEVVQGAARALHAAHSVGLLHRGVRPSNILIDQDDFAYLTDFGITAGFDENGFFGTGPVAGSWHYMPPECFRPCEADARADVYALACVLYECLTGCRPFPGDSVESQIAAHLTDVPPRPSTIQPNVPAQFDAVIAMGMAKDPDDRYATANELAEAASRVVLSETTPSPVPAPAEERADDASPVGTKHPQCFSEVDEEQAIAVLRVRGLGLIVASRRDDHDRRDRILGELKGCTVCLEFLVRFLLAVQSSTYQSNPAINLAFEKKLWKFVKEARQLMTSIELKQTDDGIPVGLKQHRCFEVVDDEKALIFLKVRGARLVVACRRDEDDDDEIDQILDELEGCAVCLGYLVRFLAGVQSSIYKDDARATAELEKQLRKSEQEARALL